MKLTTKDYHTLCANAYNNSYLKSGRNLKTMDGTTWQVVDSINDEVTGAQAFAIVPIRDKNGKRISKEPKEVKDLVIAVRGTEITSLKDVKEDLHIIDIAPIDHLKPEKVNKIDPKSGIKIGEEVIHNNQFYQVDQFAKKLNKAYPNAVKKITGHSLGGAIADYITITNKFIEKAVLFADPNIYDVVSQKWQKKIKEGHYKNKITHYTHVSEPVGTFRGDNPRAGKEFIARGTFPLGIAGFFGITGHFLDTFVFDSKGNPDIYVASEVLEEVINSLEETTNRVENTKKALQKMQQNFDMTTDTVYQEFSNKIGSGPYFDKLDITDVNEVMQDLANDSEGNLYYFYNPEDMAEVIHLITNLEKLSQETVASLQKAVRDFKNKDEDLAYKIGGGKLEW